ncbi:MAG: GNAT family N-acetyltransferase [Alicyclobacillus macrosporangiidus]|nr:GNAT family N-acetyltransferase [Alicyclobacillus macrosporangiidus]
MQALEQRVWGTEPIPLHQTWTAVKNGGVAVGAFREDEMIGFVYGFPGFRQGEAYLCSHMMGILAEHRNQGIGERLKHFQADVARRMGYRRMIWTYDPLESRNARLNLVKLGAVPLVYIENCYGELDDDLNRGMPSDRFEVTWFLEGRGPAGSPELRQVCAHAAPSSSARLLYVRIREDGLPEPQPLSDDTLQQRLGRADGGTGPTQPDRVNDAEALVRMVPVPVAIQTLRRAEPSLALSWRLETRRVFSRALEAGWVAVHLRRGDGDAVCDYILVPRDMLKVPSFKTGTLGLI